MSRFDQHLEISWNAISRYDPESWNILNSWNEISRLARNLEISWNLEIVFQGLTPNLPVSRNLEIICQDLHEIVEYSQISYMISWDILKSWNTIPRFDLYLEIVWNLGIILQDNSRSWNIVSRFQDLEIVMKSPSATLQLCTLRFPE